MCLVFHHIFFPLFVGLFLKNVQTIFEWSDLFCMGLLKHTIQTLWQCPLLSVEIWILNALSVKYMLLCSIVYMFLNWYSGGEETPMQAATAGERPNVREDEKSRKGEQWSCSQAHVGDEVWGLAISQATPPPCPPNEYCHPFTNQPAPSSVTRAAAQIMPCCQAWEEMVGGARFIISSRWQEKNRLLFSKLWYMCLTMQ